MSAGFHSSLRLINSDCLVSNCPELVVQVLRNCPDLVVQVLLNCPDLVVQVLLNYPDLVIQVLTEHKLREDNETSRQSWTLLR